MTTRFSIITPVYNTPHDVLRECIESVLAQTHTDWELILVDDNSPDPIVRNVLDEYDSNPRIRLHHRSENGGIVAASNDALDLATGEFVALLDHDDLLTSDALAVIAATISSDETIDYVYSDEDKIDADGGCFDRFNKPDWSPQRLRGQNYCTHLSVFRTTLLRDIGGFRAGFDGSQDYDLILRATERARRIVHIPEVLYHWRVIPGSAAGDVDAKPYAYPAAKRAVEEHLTRCGIQATTDHDEHLILQMRPRITREHHVAVVMPTCGTRRLVNGSLTFLARSAIASVLAADVPSGISLEIVVVADERLSDEDEHILTTLDPGHITILRHENDFNFSEHINRGVVATSADIIIVLNDDTEIVSSDWLDGLIPYLEEPDVAVVGPRLLYGDGLIQSAGHYTDLGIHHAGCGLATTSVGRFGILAMAAERSSVMFACAALRRDVFDAVGGLCELLPNSYNDIDYCHKVRAAGYRVIWTPHADVIHHESSSRDTEPPDDHKAIMWARWGTHLENSDPYLRVFDFEMAGIDDYGTYESLPSSLRGRAPHWVPVARQY